MLPNKPHGLFHEQKVQQAIPDKQKDFVGSTNVRKGQTLWEYEEETKELCPATFESTVVNLNGQVTKKLVTRKGCVYVVALNEKNAHRKALDFLLKRTKAQLQRSYTLLLQQQREEREKAERTERYNELVKQTPTPPHESTNNP
jgi:hypothetical protein